MKQSILVIAAFMFLHIVHAQNPRWKKRAHGTTVNYYHSDGKLMESWNVDKNGKLLNSNLGFAIIKYKYDKKGNITKQSHLDSLRNPSVDNLGVSIYKFKYDKNNNKIYQGHFGKDGKLMLTNNNILHTEWFWKYTKDNKLKKTKTKNKF